MGEASQRKGGFLALGNLNPISSTSDWRETFHRGRCAARCGSATSGSAAARSRSIRARTRKRLASALRCKPENLRHFYRIPSHSVSKIRKRTAGKPDKPELKPERSEGAKADAARPKAQAAGKIFCDMQGCRPVAKGCRIEAGWIGGAKNYTQQYPRLRNSRFPLTSQHPQP
jgi:hypothetical protein